MPLVYMGELTISEPQQLQINAYLKLTGQSIELQNDPNHQRYILYILEYFDYDPHRAAKAFHQAYAKGEKAAIDYTQKHMPPKPNKQTFERISTKALDRFSEIVDSEYYKPIAEYHQLQLESLHLFH